MTSLHHLMKIVSGVARPSGTGSTVTSAKPPAAVKKPRRVAGKASSIIKLSSSLSSSCRQALLVTKCF
jgi:hypothetical protein